MQGNAFAVSAPTPMSSLRQALGAAALAAVASTFLYRVYKKRQVSHRPVVVVIGSGVAGLIAAQELKHRYHCDVIVLEARDVVGG